MDPNSAPESQTGLPPLSTPTPAPTPTIPPLTPNPTPASTPTPSIQSLPIQTKSSSLPLIVLILLLLLAAGIAAFFGYQYFQRPQLAPEPLAATPTPTPTPDPTLSWSSYTNTTYNYSFRYPSNLKVGENGMGRGSVETATAVVVYEEGSKYETPRFAVTYRDTQQTLEQTANQHYQRLTTPTLTDQQRQTASQNLGYPLTNNQIISPLTQTTLLTLPAYHFTLRGSQIDDGASEYLVPEEEHRYLWVQKNDQLFLISYTTTQTKEIFTTLLQSFNFISPDTNKTTVSATLKNLSFQYPANWTRTDTEFGFTLSSGEYRIGLFAISNPKNLSVPEYQTESAKEGPSPNFYSPQSQIRSISGITGYYTLDNYCPPLLCDTFAISYQGYIYDLKVIFNSSTQADPATRAIFDQLISSSKFF